MKRNNSEKMKQCRLCGEEIRASAKVCKQCNRDQRRFWQLKEWPNLISFVLMIVTVLTFLQTRQENISAAESAKEVKRVATTVVKMSHILADGAGRFGGFPDEHLNKIKEYQKEIGESLDRNIDEIIRNDIKEVNRLLRDRINRK